MHYDGLACREVVTVREATCTATLKGSGSEERKGTSAGGLSTAGKADSAAGKLFSKPRAE